MSDCSRIVWKPEEEKALSDCYQVLGLRNWKKIAETLNQNFPERSFIAKQCRERWCNHLNPELKKGPWSQQQILTLYRCHQKYGNQWAKISIQLPGRTDNSIKNHLYSNIRRFLKAFNKNKPASERILRTMKSMIRDKNITKQIMRFEGYEVLIEEEEVKAQPEQVQVESEERKKKFFVWMNEMKKAWVGYIYQMQYYAMMYQIQQDQSSTTNQ